MLTYYNMDILQIREQVYQLNEQISKLEKQKKETPYVDEQIKLNNQIVKLKLQKECLLNSTRV